MDERDIDLGDGHSLRWISWSPDRELNPVYAEIPDDPRCGAMVTHPNGKGGICESYIGINRQLNTDAACWDVQQLEPLTLTPSLLCRICGDHGFIQAGKWVKA